MNKRGDETNRHVSDIISEKIVGMGRNNSTELNKRACKIHKRWILMLLREKTVSTVTGEKEIHKE